MKAKIVAPECENERQIVVEVDRQIWGEVCEYFPTTAVRKDIAAKNKSCRLILAAKLLSLLRSDDRTFSLSQAIMDAMESVSHRKRKAINKYLHGSRYFKIETHHSAGHHSIIWTVRRVLMRRDADQDNMRHDDDGRSLKHVSLVRLMTDELKSSRNVKDGLASWNVKWSFNDVCENVSVPWSWFQGYGRSYRNACTKMFGTDWQYVKCVESSMRTCCVGIPKLAECLKLVKARRAEEDLELPKQERRAKERRIAKNWLKSWTEWAHDPLLYLFRTKGRVYYPLVSQPRDLRYRFLNWRFGNDLDEAAEVDMSATYFVLLAHRLHDSECKRRLISDLAAGTFYQSLNAAIGLKYTNTLKLKKAVQICCLFGGRGFGLSALFRAMKTLYPDLAKYIRSQRSHRGASGLSYMLMVDESRFFIDTLLPTIVKQGIPALPVHDAIVVPRSVADTVRGTCLSLAEGHFGFRPRFKISGRVT